MSLLTDLAEYWPLDEGSGEIAHGALGALNLTCDSAGARGENGTDGLWAAEGSGFAGSAAGTVPEAWYLLANIGDTCTWAIEAEFGAASVDPVAPEVTAGESGNVIFCRMDGSGPNLYVAHGLWAALPGSGVYPYIGAGVGADDGVHHFLKAPPYTEDGVGAYVLFVECVRTDSTHVRVRLYFADSTQPNLDGEDVWDAEIPLIILGGEGNGGMVRRGALWLRVLTEEERGELTTLTTLGDMIEGGDPESGLDGDGDSVWTFDFPAVSVRRVSVIAAEGRRHTRRTAEWEPRRYELVVDLASGAEVERLRTVLAATRGGAGTLLWKHPQDDAEAVAYAIVEDIEISRGLGGQRASWRMVFEEAF